jgi:hypothetical protein
MLRCNIALELLAARLHAVLMTHDLQCLTVIGFGLPAEGAGGK